jgi:hypothetical protein
MAEPAAQHRGPGVRHARQAPCQGASAAPRRKQAPRQARAKRAAVAQPLVLAALAAGVLGAANVLAVIPALLAARSHPGKLLRAE